MFCLCNSTSADMESLLAEFRKLFGCFYFSNEFREKMSKKGVIFHALYQTPLKAPTPYCYTSSSFSHWLQTYTE